MCDQAFTRFPENVMDSLSNYSTSTINRKLVPAVICLVCRAELNSFYRVKKALSVPEIRVFDQNGISCAKLHYLMKIF